MTFTACFKLVSRLFYINSTEEVMMKIISLDTYVLLGICCVEGILEESKERTWV